MFKRGLTIIESMIYLGLVSVFLVVLTGLFVSIIEAQLEQSAGSAVDQDGQYLLARLNSDIRRAQSITSPATLGETAYSLSLNIGGVIYTYSLDAQKLQLTVSGNSYPLNSYGSNTSGFSVTRLGYATGKPTVGIDFSLTSTTVSLHQQPQNRSYHTTVGLR